MKVLTLVTACLSLVSLNSAHSQEWARFRGPNGSGVNAATKDLPATFTAQDYKWNIELPGAGTSSPVLWGNRLFLTAEGETEGSRSVLCFDSATGKQLWSHSDSFKPHGHHKFNNFASATPAVDAVQVYVAWTSGDEMHVLALSHEGKKKWEANLGFFSEEHGSGASPVVVGNVLIVSKDHHKEGAFLTGLDIASGKTVWKLPRKTTRSSFSTPMIVEAEKGKPIVVFSSNPKALTAVEPATGKVLWNKDYAAATEYRAVGSPTYCDGVYFTNVGQGSSGQSGVALKIVNGQPETAWELPKAMPYVPTPLALDGHFYVLNDGGVMSCLKAATGEVVYKERLFENAYSSPVCAGDKIYCISRTGKVAVVKAGEKFELLGKADLGEPCESTPAIANGMIYIRTAKHLIALGGDKSAALNFYHGTGVDIEMVAENQAIIPGIPFTVGFSLKHVKGWHSYWKNPGLAGVPFKVDWTLPEGWQVGPMQYAPPDKVYMAQYRTHGYERDVIHLVDLVPPPNIPAGETTLKVHAHWLACSTTCHIGNCNLELSIPVTKDPAQPNPLWSQAIKDARNSEPKPNQEWQFAAKRADMTVTLTCTPLHPESTIPAITPEPIFFSENRLICSDPVQKWAVKEGKLVGELTVPDYAATDPNQLTGLLYANGKYVPLNLSVRSVDDLGGGRSNLSLVSRHSSLVTLTPLG